VQKWFESLKSRVKRANERDRKLDQPIEKVSRLIWPWPESKLIQFVCILAAMDYTSTFAALHFNYSHQVYEFGPLAKWALTVGGFSELLVIDIVVISSLILLASLARAFYNRFGFPGFGRSAFVFIFVPYAIIMLPIIFNNIISTFR
jgi:hypothetical protein